MEEQIKCLKCNKDLFHQSTTENRKEYLKVLCCKKCGYEILIIDRK